MSRPKEFEVSPALDAVLDSFWARGYEATSMSDLESSTGLSRSSLYSTFGNKRELFEAALTRYNEQTIEPTLHALESPGAGLKELQQYFATLVSTLRGDPELAVRGCLIVNTMVELASQDNAAGKTAAAYFERVRKAIDNGIRGAVATKAGKAVPKFEARKIASSIVGALVIAHFNPKMAADICDQLSAEVSAAYQ